MKRAVSIHHICNEKAGFLLSEGSAASQSVQRSSGRQFDASEGTVNIIPGNGDCWLVEVIAKLEECASDSKAGPFMNRGLEAARCQKEPGLHPFPLCHSLAFGASSLGLLMKRIPALRFSFWISVLLGLSGPYCELHT